MIVKQAPPPDSFRKGRIGILIGMTAFSLFGVVTAFSTAPNTVMYSGRTEYVLEQISGPAMRLLEPERAGYIRETRVQLGDTVSSLLSRLGIQDDDAINFLRSRRETEVIFRQLIPGKAVNVRVSPAGELQNLFFPMSGSKNTALLVERTDQGLTAKEEPLELDTRLSIQSAVIRHSLFGAADDAGIPESVATQLADIFGGDIDFHRDLRRGDSFSVIYKTVSHRGKPIRTERILAAEFNNGGKALHAFWHQGSDSSGGYYGADGRSIRKAFLRSPLEFSRITSGFSSARYHPVLQETRAHQGVDYGAPVGTRVKATGNGVVELAGTQGGYGKVVILRHPGDKITVYGHLSGFAPNLRTGTRVSQGDIIGYVGATGLATGPHLHYEFRVNGIHRNPLTIALPDARPLPASQLQDFRSVVDDLGSQLSLVRDRQLVMLD